MLDADLRSKPLLRVAGDVSRGPDIRHAGAQLRIDDDAVVDRQSGTLSQFGARLHADTEHHEIGHKPFASLELDGIWTNRTQLRTQVEADALLFVELLDVLPHAR